MKTSNFLIVLIGLLLSTGVILLPLLSNTYVMPDDLDRNFQENKQSFEKNLWNFKPFHMNQIFDKVLVLDTGSNPSKMPGVLTVYWIPSSTYGVKLSAFNDYEEGMTVKDGTLILYKKEGIVRGDNRLLIYTPNIRKISTQGIGLRLEGWKTDSLELNLTKCKTASVDSLNQIKSLRIIAEQSAILVKSEASLQGLTANLSKGSALELNLDSCSTVWISGDSTSFASVKPYSLEGKKLGNARIRRLAYDGVKRLDLQNCQVDELSGDPSKLFLAMPYPLAKEQLAKWAFQK